MLFFVVVEISKVECLLLLLVDTQLLRFQQLYYIGTEIRVRIKQDSFFLLFMNGDCLAELGGQRSKPNTNLNLVVNKKQPLVREKVKHCLVDFYPQIRK